MALQRLPAHAPGMTIGLFGGSFNPAHEGHRHVSMIALKRLGLDAVWWLVTPGNPLKNNKNLESLATRMAAARKVAAHPKVHMTDFEEAIDSRYTDDTLTWLTRRCPGVRFVWLMGADNLLGFDRWQNWRRIASLMPLAIVDRPGVGTKAPLSKAARILAPYRLSEGQARALRASRPPAWIFLHAPLNPASSTALRRKGDGNKMGAPRAPSLK